MPYPLPLTRTEAYLAYKAGVIQQSDLKPSLTIPRNGIDAWLAYWTGVSTTYPVKNVGKNLFDKNTCVKGALLADGTIDSVTYGDIRTSNYIPVTAGEKYTVSGTPGGWGVVGFYTSNKVFINRPYSASHVYKVPDGAGYARVVCTKGDLNTCQFEKGSAASGYEAYTSEPLILQEEEAYIAYLSGVINEYPEKCLRRVGAYLRYLISARWGRPDHPLNREELYLSLIKTQVIPSGDPSSDIVIDGTAKAPFQDVKVYGDTFQQSYTGKNLWPIDSSIPAYNCTIITGDNSLTIVATGLNSNIYPAFNLEANTQYTFSGEFKITNFVGASSIGAVLQGYDGSSWAVIEDGRSEVSDTNTHTFSVSFNSASYSQVRVGFGTNVWNTSIANTVVLSNPQLEKGTATAYEPFVGGQPSPSPSYPQQIQTVTGEQTVTVMGKNLLKLNDWATTLGGVPITTTNGTVNLKGTATSSAQGYYVTIGMTASEPMVFSPNKSTVMSGLDVKLQYKRGETVYYPSVGDSLSLQAGDIIQQMYLIVSNGSVLDGSFSPMLEKGSTKTSFEPYSKQTLPLDLGTIELCKLGTYQDYIWKDGDDWKVHKAIKKSVFDQNSGWMKNQYGTNSYSTEAEDIFTVASEIGVISPQFIGKSYYDRVVATNNIIYVDTGLTDRGITVRNTAWSDLTNFITWITSNPVTAYYVLATPTDTVITDQNLIDQLEALVNGGAEDGTTYIKVNATDPNLPGLLYVEAPKYE